MAWYKATSIRNDRWRSFEICPRPALYRDREALVSIVTDRLQDGFVKTLHGFGFGLGLLAGLLAACGSDSSTASQTADTTPPINVVITAPAAGHVSGTVILKATASDNRGVVSMGWKVNGGIVLATDFTKPFTYSWDTSVNGPGIYDWEAVASDAAGNSTTSTNVRFLVP
jgi:hypothetical protein